MKLFTKKQIKKLIRSELTALEKRLESVECNLTMHLSEVPCNSEPKTSAIETINTFENNDLSTQRTTKIGHEEGKVQFRRECKVSKHDTIVYDNEVITFIELSKILGIKASTLTSRRRNGWTDAEIIKSKLHKRTKKL